LGWTRIIPQGNLADYLANHFAIAQPLNGLNQMKTVKVVTLITWLLMASLSMAELSVTSTSVKALTQLVTPEIVSTNLVLVGEGSSLAFTDMAVISVKTSAKTVIVKAKTALFESKELRRSPVNDWQWFLSGDGIYEVTVTGYTDGVGLEDKVIKVVVGSKPPVPTPTPTPTPDPVPDIPPDAFNNIAQQVALIAAKLPKRTEVAELYANGSKRLRSDPSTTINNVADDVVNSRNKLLGPDAAIYSAFATLVAKEMNAKWPMSRVTFADFLAAVARGLNPSIKCANGVCPL
jgi:hypothetical protein